MTKNVINSCIEHFFVLLNFVWVFQCLSSPLEKGERMSYLATAQVSSQESVADALTYASNVLNYLIVLFLFILLNELEAELILLLLPD